MFKQSSFVITLLLANSVQGVEHHHQAKQGVSSNDFAKAAVQARIDADMDIGLEIQHHHKISADAHNKAWKKHFKDSSFYKSYAQHNTEQKEVT